MLVLEDGTVFRGRGLGAFGHTLGEVCFNTSMTGYQEILTDPSYAGQIITFTFPHIGNVGTNDEDIEFRRPSCRGLVLREDITPPANWRARASLDRWLKDRNLIGIAGVDTRRLVGRIRDRGAPKGCLAFAPDGRYDLAHLQERRGAVAGPRRHGPDGRGVLRTSPIEWTEHLLVHRGRLRRSRRALGPSRRLRGLRRQAQHPALPCRSRLPRHRRPGAQLGRRRSSPCGPTGSFFPTVPAIRRRPASSRFP